MYEKNSQNRNKAIFPFLVTLRLLMSWTQITMTLVFEPYAFAAQLSDENVHEIVDDNDLNMARLENNSRWEMFDSTCIFLTFLALYITINKNHPTRHYQNSVVCVCLVGVHFFYPKLLCVINQYYLLFDAKMYNTCKCPQLLNENTPFYSKLSNMEYYEKLWVKIIILF